MSDIFRTPGRLYRGFALIDALFRLGRAADIDEAYALAVMFAEQTQTEMPERAPEGAVRLAWAHHLRSHADSALASLGEWHDAIRGDAAWARRLAMIEVAAADHDAAWRTLTLLSARARRRDVEVESLLVSTQRALHYPDDRRLVGVGGERGGADCGNKPRSGRGGSGAAPP